MNVDLKLLVRLLLAILVVSLISTLFLGKHIHKHIIESVKKQDHKSKEIHSETKISKNISSENPTEVYLESPLQISTEIITNYQTEKLIGTENADTITAKKFDDLKIRKNAWLKLLQKKGDRRDWHNRHAMARDSRRKGLGEVGRGASIPNRKPFGNTLLGLHGFQAQLSDLISVNRSLPDIKPARCHIIKYLKILPNATVVISFHNEHLSVLLRSIHSLVNRSPKELLPEIILVDDASNLPNLGQNLVDYVAKAFGKRVSLVRLAKRCGLIRARMEGARRATCQVLIFLDSHIEVTHNWLPPLLEPIAIHRTIATGPIVDEISRETFAYNLGSVLTRSGFDWRFHIKHLPRFNDDSWDPSSPYRTPLLVGALAIDRRYFWELGGYDEELDIWGGELLEMGFKIWMCGGMMIYIPCSRVGHISRGPVLKRSSPRNYNYLGRVSKSLLNHKFYIFFTSQNYKRVAEVWMDDYKKFIYERNPELFHNVNVGNLTTLKALRKHLKCKSFNWYMTKVAPDFLEKFPTVEKPPLASGLIQSLAEPSLCLDVLNGEHNHPVGLARCTNPVDKNQDWTLTQDHEIRLKSGNVCLEQSGTQAIKDVMLYHCHSLGGNQFWYYNPMLKWFQEGEGWYRCLEAILPKGSTPGGVISSYCDKSNIRQKWNFGGL
ncbi:hypothetical protein KR054_012031 [Drosophila jambulina]|nr:hypothetical protein KR054_012031 [Drosophila jambulina]